MAPMSEAERSRVSDAHRNPDGRPWESRPGDVAIYCDPLSESMTLHHVAVDPVGWARARAQERARRQVVEVPDVDLEDRR